MKKLILICLTLIINQIAFSQTEAIDKFVRKYKRGAKEKTDITLPGFVVRFGLNFVDEDDLEGVDVKRLARKISELRIVNIEKDWTDDSKKPDFQQFLNEVRAEKFEELMTVRDNGEHVNILIREKGNFIRDFLVIVDEKGGEMSLISFSGKFTMEDINKVMENVNFDEKGKNKVKTVPTVKD